MTVMIDCFFGIHPFVVRSGLWAKLKPGEVNLYVFLLEESERCCTRQLTVTDEQAEVVGTKSRTLCNARKKLQEYGLIRYERTRGNKYKYTICDPKTGQPYPGGPTIPLVVPKRFKGRTNPATITGSPATAAPQILPVKSEAATKHEEPLESHGLPGVFSETGSRIGRFNSPIYGTK